MVVSTSEGPMKTTKIPLFRPCLLVFACLCLGGPLQASPCSPSDPEGENPGNLCLVYPTHGMTLSTNTFRQGYATNGFYGISKGPSQPGMPIQPGHIPRAAMDPVPGTNRSGFWTSIKAENGNSTTVRTNTGKEWTMQVVKP